MSHRLLVVAVLIVVVFCAKKFVENVLIQDQPSSETLTRPGKVSENVGLIVTHLLVHHRNLSARHQDLEFELKSLKHLLIFAELAIQDYRDRPLAQSLASTVTPVMSRCCIVLQELFDKATGTWSQ